MMTHTQHDALYHLFLAELTRARAAAVAAGATSEQVDADLTRRRDRLAASIRP